MRLGRGDLAGEAWQGRLGGGAERKDEQKVKEEEEESRKGREIMEFSQVREDGEEMEEDK